MKIEMEPEELLCILNGANDKMYEKIRLIINGFEESQRGEE